MEFSYRLVVPPLMVRRAVGDRASVGKPRWRIWRR